jgi:catechol 2,3-dioxygenase-like lactoylglutathione lyase family enzyme
MRIKLTSVFVDNQEKALKFYTEVLGFVKKTELPAGDFKWLTVVSEGKEDIEFASRTECKSSCHGVPESDFSALTASAYAAPNLP